MAYRIVRNDITKVKADIIVNSANPRPICGGSTEAVIFDAAGYDDLLAARKKVGRLHLAQVGVTSAFNLPAKNIIHVSCPWWREERPDNSCEILASCYAAVLDKALELEAKSIAFPLLSSGVYRFPKNVAIRVAKETFEKYEQKDIDITLVVYDCESFVAAEEFSPDILDMLEGKPAKTESALSSPVRHKSTSKALEKNPAWIFEAPLEEETESSRKDFEPQPGMLFLNLNHFSKALAEEKPDSRVLSKRQKDEQGVNYFKSVERIKEEVVPASLRGFATKKQAKTAKSASKPELEEEIGKVIMSMDDDTFQDKMIGYMTIKGLATTDVYRAANLDRKLFSKLKKDSYVPSKNTVLAVAVGLQLNYEEATDLLSRAGFAFSPASKRDMIIKHFIQKDGFYQRKGMHPIDVINDCLTYYQQDPLGVA